MNRVRSVFSVLLAALAVMAVAAAPVYAAPSSFEAIDVVLHEDPAGSLLIVSGVLPEAATLPADVQLSVPAGSELQWAGEILGGPVEQDPSVQPAKETRGNADVYSFTMTKGRTAQLEVVPVAAVARNGDDVSVTLSWPAPADVAEVNIGVRIPQAAQITTTAEGAEVAPGPSGYSYYRKSVAGVKGGDVVSLAFAYNAPAGAAGQGGTAGTPASSTSPGAGGFVPILLAVAAAVGLIVLVSRKLGSRTSEPEPVVAPAKASASKKTKPTAVRDDAEELDSEPDAPAAARSSRPVDPNMRRNQAIIFAAVAVIAVVLLFFAVRNAGKATYEGDTASMTYSSQEACDNVTFGLGLAPGDATTDKTEDIFESLREVPGIVSATVSFTQPSVAIAYCATQATADDLSAALDAAGAQPTGVVASGVPTAPSATPTATPAPSAPATTTP